MDPAIDMLVRNQILTQEELNTDFYDSDKCCSENLGEKLTLLCCLFEESVFAVYRGCFIVE